MKGKKSCKKCGQIMGVRTRICIGCGIELIPPLKYNKDKDKDKQVRLPKIARLVKSNEDLIKIPQTKEQQKTPIISGKDIDWHELEDGDIIKVEGGPVWITEDNIEVKMGDEGIFKVIRCDSNGIHARGQGKKSGRYYIWMGQEHRSDSGLIKRPHKILKVKKRNN